MIRKAKLFYPNCFILRQSQFLKRCIRPKHLREILHASERSQTIPPETQNLQSRICLSLFIGRYWQNLWNIFDRTDNPVQKWRTSFPEIWFQLRSNSTKLWFCESAFPNSNRQPELSLFFDKFRYSNFSVFWNNTNKSLMGWIRKHAMIRSPRCVAARSSKEFLLKSNRQIWRFSERPMASISAHLCVKLLFVRTSSEMKQFSFIIAMK